MAAPKGNKYALGLTETGRPPFFAKPEDMQSKILEYFDHCEKNKENLKITGLCLFLGFESRQSFYDYEVKEDFSYTVKRAKMVIESHYEEGLNTFKYGGSVFGLKNLGWKDQVEQNISQVITTVTPQVITPETPLSNSESEVKL
jgi:hypothetical protein